MVAIEGNGDGRRTEEPATELQWRVGDSHRRKGERRDEERTALGGFRCCTFISRPTHAQTDKRSGCAVKDPLARPERPTHADGNGSGIIVDQNIRTFFISKAKERKGFGRKGRDAEEERRGEEKRAGRASGGIEAVIEAEYKVALFRYDGRRRDALG